MSVSIRVFAYFSLTPKNQKYLDALIIVMSAMSNREGVVVNSKETAVIVVDMQRDFCYDDGALFVGEQVRRIIPKISALVEGSRSAGLQLVFTQDWHPQNDEEFAIWGRHCVQNTIGAELIDELLSEDAFLVRKRKYSAFFETALESYLRATGITTLIITGVVTNICVLHTAIDAALRGFGILVPEDCVAALSDYEQEYGLYHIENVLKGRVISSDAISFQ